MTDQNTPENTIEDSAEIIESAEQVEAGEGESVDIDSAVKELFLRHDGMPQAAPTALAELKGIASFSLDADDNLVITGGDGATTPEEFIASYLEERSWLRVPKEAETASREEVPQPLQENQDLHTKRARFDAARGTYGPEKPDAVLDERQEPASTWVQRRMTTLSGATESDGSIGSRAGRLAAGSIKRN